MILCVKEYYEKNLRRLYQRLVYIRFIIFAVVHSDCGTFTRRVLTDTPTISRCCHIFEY